MFLFAQRRAPQRPPIGGPGISEAQYERILTRLREKHRIVSASTASGRVKDLFGTATYQRESTTAPRGTSP